MNAIIVDDEEMTLLVENLKNYPALTNVHKFGEDVSIVRDYLRKKSLEIDVAFLDHYIGDARGTDLGGWINRNFPHIACILITGGSPSDPDEKHEPLLDVCMESMEKGFCAFLLKSKIGKDNDVLVRSLNRIFKLDSIAAKQQTKLDRLKGGNLEDRLRSKYKVYDFYATEMVLHSVELISRLFHDAMKHHDCTTLQYSRCFATLEKELAPIKLKGEPFTLMRFGNSSAKKGYYNEMESIRDFFKKFDYADIFARDRIMSGSAKSLRVNRLHKFFSGEKNKEIAYLLLSDNPEEWAFARKHFIPVKEIISNFHLE